MTTKWKHDGCGRHERLERIKTIEKTESSRELLERKLSVLSMKGQKKHTLRIRWRMIRIETRRPNDVESLDEMKAEEESEASPLNEN
jgi:hypothetical protein